MSVNDTRTGESTSEDLPPAKELTPSEIVVLVRTEALSELVGARETDQADFKSKPYDLDLNRDKQSLIADVAQFANARGGVLVIGVETVMRPNERVEVAAAVVGYTAGLIIEDRYRKVLHDRIAPLVRDIRFYFANVEGSGDDSRQVAVIEVAAQHDRDKPFIVDRLVDDDDRRVTNAFGWPERSGDSTFWHPKERVQQLIAAGLRTQTPVEVAVPDEQRPGQELSEAWSASGVNEPTPRLGVQVVPVDPDRGFDDFFGRDAQELRQWRPVRGSGFGFDLGWHAPEPRGNRFVAEDTNAALVLSREGLITVATGFETRSFRWATPDSDEFVFINAFALTEWVAEVVRVAYEFVGPRLEPARWEIRVVADDLRPDPTVAISPPARIWPVQAWPATTPAAQLSYTGSGDWEADSFEVLAEIYGQLFGRPPSDIFGADLESRRVDLWAISRYPG